MEALTIRVRGGATVTVPTSASCVSTYVLLEQEDWFEKELSFVRRILRPGMRAVDIGANFGCYSVALGRAVGPTGKLWLFEPASTTFEYLRHTLALNNLPWVHASQLALSDREGTAELSIGASPELNSLGHPANGGATEVVSLTTLDRARLHHAIDSIDFVKLDAEGEEVRIVAGGQEFFRSEDPLVMFEAKHGDQVNTDLPSTFEQIGYSLYRLIGPDTVLVPARTDGELKLDDFELNLFACKPGRAATLEALGSLIPATRSVGVNVRFSGSGLQFWRGQPFTAAFPADVAVRDPLYARSLDYYAFWRDAAQHPAQRYAALRSALSDLMELVRRTPTLPRLFTLARIAREAGARSVAVRSLQEINAALDKGHVPTDEPCWPALERYDALSSKGSVAMWLAASAAEGLATSLAFSGYFSGPTALPWLDWLHGSPFASAPMDRRRELQAISSGRQSRVEGSSLLQQHGEDNLNPQLWAAGATIQLK